MLPDGSRPHVSIVLPFLNSKGFLSEAIDSILAQEGDSAWELLLVNDGSDDRDVQIADYYQQRTPGRIHLLSHPADACRGISASRNLGIAHARGELIAFLDADDTWFSHKLAAQVELFRQQPRAGLVYGPGMRWWSWMGGDDVIVPALIDGFGTDCLVPGAALLSTYLRDETLTPCIGSVMVRRSVLQDVNGFEEQFAGLYDDQVLYAKICQNERVFASSNCVSRYRQHAQSCCGRAEVDGTASAGRTRFLNWLNVYLAARKNPQAELALSGC